MAEVVWSLRATRQLHAIRAYIAAENPYAARRTFLKVLSAADSLELLPNRGRPINGGRRELTHVRPYLIQYRVRAARVTILQIRHAAREPD